MTGKKLQFVPQQKICEFSVEESVLEVALKHRIPLNHSCGGMGSCTTCRVLVERSLHPLPERNEIEQEIANSRGFKAEERLACQLPPSDGLVLRIPETRPEMREDSLT